MLRSTALAAALLFAPIASAQSSGQNQIRIDWNKPAEPFKIIGNIYYVGTAGLSSFLITSPNGHILIDGALEESAPQILANIEKLGFKAADVKILLINHAHYDHSGGLAALKKATGARLLASAAEKPVLEAGKADYRPDLSGFPPVKVDQMIGEGSLIALGGNRLIARLTPGHTKGCTSFTMRVPSGGRSLDVLFACSLSVADQPLEPGKGYDAAVSDFRATFAKLKTVKADVYLAYHPQAFDYDAKRAKLAAGDANAFVDPTELPRRVQAAEVAFEAELAKTKR